MTTVLGQNQYGKAQIRLVRVDHDGATHRLRDLNVSIALTGAMDAVHHRGDNTGVLPTDTMKNTAYAFAQRDGTAAPEDFALRLARHFTGEHETIATARVRVEEYGWRRTGRTGHSFVREGAGTRTAEVLLDAAGCRVTGGLTDLTVLNSTGSEFHGFTKDRYTTLAGTTDRVLATDVDARWRFGWSGTGDAPDWDAVHARSRSALLEAFTTTHSYSLQQTLYAMGARVVDAGPEIDEVRLSLPNKHHFLVDLTPFGIANDTAQGAVYHAADRPYGLIEGTVLREGAPQLLPTD
jgi:urate oxidase